MPRSSEGSRLIRGLCFTHNNWEEGDIEKIIEAMKPKAAYIIIGKETGAEGTRHLQGYIKLSGRLRLKKCSEVLKEALGKGCWTAAAKGTPTHNVQYCSKDGDYVEWGLKPEQGKRMDLEAAYEDARSDIPMVEVADMHRSTFIRYHKGIKAVRELHDEAMADHWRDVRVVVHSGPTGCGKTRTAMEWIEEDRAPYKIQGRYLKWWDRYEAHKKIVIDEYSNNVSIDEMLALLDGYKLRLPIKGGFTYARWTEVHITTNLKWEEWHDQAKPEHRAALKRRISEWRSYWEETPWTKAKSAMEDIPKRDYYMEVFSDENGKAL